MGSDTVAGAIRAAAEDRDVKAILFRVDSPGGSYVASDTIWREVVRARQAGKPVIVSMGNLAGSGGYFVAMAADKIVAEPGTITASIGVLGGKMLTSGLWDKVGLSWDEVHQGENATMFTGTHDFTPAEWGRFQAWLDRCMWISPVRWPMAQAAEGKSVGDCEGTDLVGPGCEEPWLGG